METRRSIGQRQAITRYTWLRKLGHSPRSAMRLVVFYYAKDHEEIKRRMARIGTIS